jgi:hypothetical protein
VTDRLDRLFEEVNRQLAESQARATSLATRAGLVLSAGAVAVGVLAAGLPKAQGGIVVAFAVLGVAIVAGIVVLLPDLPNGPSSTQLTGWSSNDLDAQVAVGALYLAKVGMLEAILRRLTLITYAFYLEAVTVTAAVVIALVVAAGS